MPNNNLSDGTNTWTARSFINNYITEPLSRMISRSSYRDATTPTSVCSVEDPEPSLSISDDTDTEGVDTDIASMPTNMTSYPPGESFRYYASTRCVPVEDVSTRCAEARDILSTYSPPSSTIVNAREYPREGAFRDYAVRHASTRCEPVEDESVQNYQVPQREYTYRAYYNNLAMGASTPDPSCDWHSIESSTYYDNSAKLARPRITFGEL